MERLGRLVVLVLSWPVLAVGLWTRRRPAARTRPTAATTPPALDWPFLWVLATSSVAPVAFLTTLLGLLTLVLGPPSLLSWPAAIAAALAWPATKRAQRQALERWMSSRR